jgi:hypothetical protein
MASNSTIRREPPKTVDSSGKPAGGRFAPKPPKDADKYDDAIIEALDASSPTADPPLRDFRVIGSDYKVYKTLYGEPVRPAGVCYNCGSPIAHCVVIENPKTGEIVDVGETCAERVGLDLSHLREMLRERRKAERQEELRLETEAAERTRAEQEAAATAKFGEHGTESRWTSGCRCNLCSAQAPHGNVGRLTYGKCYCSKCLQAAIDSGVYHYEERRKLVDLETHKVLHAKCVRTRYGLSWVVDHEDGSASWYPYSPARRNTLAKRGAVEVNVKCLIRSYRYNGEKRFKEVTILESSNADVWNEPVQVDLS